MADCENVNCSGRASYEVKVRVRGDRGNFPTRKLCRICSGKTVASGRVTTLKNLESKS